MDLSTARLLPYTVKSCVVQRAHGRTILFGVESGTTVEAGFVRNSVPYCHDMTGHVTGMSQKRAPASSTHSELKTRHLGGVKSDDHVGMIDR